MPASDVDNKRASAHRDIPCRVPVGCTPGVGVCGSYMYDGELSTSRIDDRPGLVFLCFKSGPPMKLLMFVGDELIESVSLDKELVSKPGYLGNYKRRLQNKYRDLYLSGTRPEFFVANDTTEIVPTARLIRG